MTDLLVEFLTKGSIIRSQIYPFFKGIYKLCPFIQKCLYTLSFLQRCYNSNFTYCRRIERLYKPYIIIWLLSLFYFSISSSYSTLESIEKIEIKRIYYKMRIGYCGNFNLELLSFFQEPVFPTTRIYLTINSM